jgi:hypothetical protein
MLKPNLVYLFSCRNLEAYGLTPNQEVCAASAVIRYLGPKACLSPCTFLPEVEPQVMVCAIEDDVDLATVKSGISIVHGDLGKLYTW